MKLDSVKRIKTYKKDERVVLILNIRLPRLLSTDEGEDFSFINDFYSSMIEETSTAILEKIESVASFGNNSVRVGIDFSDITNSLISAKPKLSKKFKKPLFIERRIMLKTENDVQAYKFKDLFELDGNLIIS